MAKISKLLFVCSFNRDRSQTAELLYRYQPGFEVKSAGTSEFAITPLSEPLIDWADIIVAMEREHESFIRLRYPDSISEKQIFCLEIPDTYRFMNDTLVNLIKERMKQFLTII
jgi:predicted protein tyrosine phosphatase